MQGAVPDTSQKTPESLMREVQESSAVSPSAAPLEPHPGSPQVPQPSVQHIPEASTPAIPLLHTVSVEADVVRARVVDDGVKTSARTETSHK